MRIRPAESADAAPIASLLDELGYPQDGVQSVEARLKTFADNPASMVLVAEQAVEQATEAAELLGVIAVHVSPFFEKDGSWARIVALVVADQARGRGIGAELVAAAEAFAIERGCSRMEVTSSDRRARAHDFYLARGYLDQAGKSSRFLRDL
ncbi:GNAT family N-acetyltransferase [Kribbella deserti]|uniref:GNAT family N-acetyltransferase n=1 Tax=Kribbella deserti TaxID=1926257 RepID=A0ABV6QV31_9ACTN